MERRMFISRMGFVFAMLLIALLASVLTLTFVYVNRLWESDVVRLRKAVESDSVAEDVVLRWDTPVLHEWRDAQGSLVGTYAATTLYEYTDDSAAIGGLSTFETGMSTLAHWLATDPDMREHLARHGFTDAQLDLIAARFDSDPELEAYLAYHAP